MPEKNPFLGATFAERKAARLQAQKPTTKAVDDEAAEVENKAVASKKATKKTATKRPQGK